MASVDINKVDKFFGSTQVLHEVEIGIQDGEFVVLVGPSGCGKSTLLRMIAGLEEISRGEIAIGGRVVNNVPPKDRDIAMVFQNYALYPHMTVHDNMAFSLKLARAPKTVIQERVNRAAQILGLTEYLGRYPRQLSGGQRQRVQMRTEVKELHQRLKTTSVYVTHDQIEAMTMADRIVVMHDGVVEQVGQPLELYDHPDNLFVAGFIGSPAMNFIEATLRGAGNGGGNRPVAVTDDGTELPLPPSTRGQSNQRVIYGIRPEHLTLNPGGGANGPGSLASEVIVVEPTGAEILVFTRTAGHEIAAVFRERHAFQPGDRIALTPDLGAVHLFDAATGARLNP